MSGGAAVDMWRYSNENPSMPGGAAVDLWRCSNDHWDGNEPFESQFDLMQLCGTHIPFVDPQRHAQRPEGDSYVIMPGSEVEDLRRQSIEHWDGYAPSQSHFDPMELWGTQIPFVDPFNYDEHTFWADTPAAPPASMKGASLSNMRRRIEGKDGHPRFQAVPARQVARLETHLLGRGEKWEESWTGRRDESGGGRTGKRDAPERGCVRGETDCEIHRCHQVPLPPQRIVQLAASAIDTCTELQRLPGPEVVLRMDRVKLRPEQAIYIFQQRSIKTSRTAALLSAKFGITSKAIRDIWKQRSWADETRGLEDHLDV